MILSSAFNTFVIVLISCIVASSSREDESETQVQFTNVSEEDVVIKWYNHANKSFVNVGDIASGNGFTMSTGIGHTFSYIVGGVEHEFTVEDSKSNVVIGPEHFRVKCSTTEGDIHANIIPSWSPFGAARFIHLVRIGYFNGCALNRVVKGFLTQFGISSDMTMRNDWRQKTIADDIPIFDLPFRPGYMSYAGSGPSSRSTEVFIAMPDVSEQQLKHFGTNPWETPFGYVLRGDLHVLDKLYSYGDIVPFGKGPDPQKIYLKDGYDYLKREFPAISYINSCEIMSPKSKTREVDEF